MMYFIQIFINLVLDYNLLHIMSHFIFILALWVKYYHFQLQVKKLKIRKGNLPKVKQPSDGGLYYDLDPSLADLRAPLCIL